MVVVVGRSILSHHLSTRYFLNEYFLKTAREEKNRHFQLKFIELQMLRNSAGQVGAGSASMALWFVRYWYFMDCIFILMTSCIQALGECVGVYLWVFWLTDWLVVEQVQRMCGWIERWVVWMIVLCVFEWLPAWLTDYLNEIKVSVNYSER